MKGKNKMTNVQLSEEGIKQLINAYVDYKRAEDKFKQLRDTLCKDLVPGRYDSKYGYVTKTTAVTTKTDWQKLLWDHPEIDVSTYESTKEVTRIIVNNMNTASGFFGK